VLEQDNIEPLDKLYYDSITGSRLTVISVHYLQLIAWQSPVQLFGGWGINVLIIIISGEIYVFLFSKYSTAACTVMHTGCV
jgi:hypothetical protein